MKIGVFDSGKGGTTILQAVKEILPNEEYYYIADSKNCPYGEKTDEALMQIVVNNVEKLKEWGAKIIIIACNTATTKCIDKLRLMYPDLVFVGTEPAVKLAAESNAKKILVMATPGTIESERLLQLICDNKKPDQKIELLACSGLADTIENGGKIDEALKRMLNDAGKYELVVLGCTHYSLIKDKIQKFFPNATLIDGNKGVAKRVKYLVEEVRKDK